MKCFLSLLDRGLAIACLAARLAVFGCLSGVALPLAGCSTSAVPAPSQLATDVGLVASGLASVVAAIAALPGVSAATVAQVQGYIATIQADAAQVAAATANVGTSVVQEIATTVSAVAGVVLPLFPATAGIAAIVQAAMSLLPTIMAAVGITSAPSTPPVYMADQARLILRSATN